MAYAEYPRLLYKDSGEGHENQTLVHSDDDRDAHLAQGWRLTQAVPEGSDEATDPLDVSGLTVPESLDVIAGAETAEALDHIEAFENARPKPRLGVQKAIDGRREELAE